MPTRGVGVHASGGPPGPPNFIILGSGYTGSRVAKLLRDQGCSVTEIRTRDIDFTQRGSNERLRSFVTPGCAVLHSIPSLPEGADATLLGGLADLPQRVVYLSTTGIYGPTETVNEHTAPNPSTPRQRARLETEQAVQQGPWSSLILRPAAIYGPDRGAHIAMAQGRYHLLGDGSNYISRIHVDDLAAIAAAALLSQITGAYPVADQHPCSSREIAEFCAAKFSLPMPSAAPLEDIPESRRTNRRVDGSAICCLLGVTLKYPSYREGLLA